jgi:hypothetical protein
MVSETIHLDNGTQNTLLEELEARRDATEKKIKENNDKILQLEKMNCYYEGEKELAEYLLKTIVKES